MTRFYKDPSNKKISGVCAGLSDSFGIDVTFLRIVWAFLILGYGVGLLPYIICAVVMPNKSLIDY